MLTEQKLKGEIITLRQIEISDCVSSYVEWLNDSRVNCYLETRWNRQSLESVREFVKAQRENDHSILFAITLVDGGCHIGNIKIGPVNWQHRHGDISYFIGDTRYWKKGIATEAINLVCKFGFECLNLHRIEASVYAAAVASWKALEKNGFLREGVFRRKVITDIGGGTWTYTDMDCWNQSFKSFCIRR